MMGYFQGKVNLGEIFGGIKFMNDILEKEKNKEMILVDRFYTKESTGGSVINLAYKSSNLIYINLVFLSY